MAYARFYLIFFIVLNIFLLSNTQYIGTPQNLHELKLYVKKPLELICEYTGADGEGQFLQWFKNDVVIIPDKSNHYVIKDTKKESKLIINLHEEDQDVRKWSVKTRRIGQEEPIQCQFGQLSLISSPQGMSTNRMTEKLTDEYKTVKRLEKEAVHLKCLIVPSQTNQNQNGQVQWEFTEKGEKFAGLPDGVRITNGNEIVIDSVKKTHQGHYRCSLNNQSYTGLLRVRDPFAALWPFIGIVSTVLVLVIIILIYERRQKAAKKRAAVVEDEINDNANDPLVTSSNKLADNENKKRTVKA